jgi:hypothetical protein
MTLKQLEKAVEHSLDIYTLEEILDYNDVTVSELLVMLVQDGTIKLPEVEPL